MNDLLTPIEIRLLGSLVEKQLTTPEYYPLTLNALTAACNQKSNRDPVMTLDESSIMSAIENLRERNLVYLYFGSNSRTVKYKHMIPNVLETDPAETALIALLFLRGPQTAGELRARSERLHQFASVAEVQQTLDDLANKSEPIIVRLDRQPGQKEQRYAHLLSGPVEQESVSSKYASNVVNQNSAVDRIAVLEDEVSHLRNTLDELQKTFDEFRNQFD